MTARSLLRTTLVLTLLAGTACKKAEQAPPAPAAPADAAVPIAPPPAPADAALAAAPTTGNAVVDAADRTEADRQNDQTRKPAELLAFLAVKPGMNVADLGAGDGYMTELLARSVAPGGKVYAQNSKAVIEKFVKESWPARLTREAMKNVVRVDRELDAPLPPEAKDLDLVTMGFFYHDTVWMKTDRAKMNKAVFDALKPGGAFVILDHETAPGAGTTVGETLHRIEKKVVIAEVEKAGFELDGEATFLASADDAHDKNVFDEAVRGKTDRFVLRFVKPAAK